MTRDQLIKRNDALRTTLKGAIILFTPELMDFSYQLRGRLIWRFTIYNTFSDDSLHDEGVFVFAGYSIIWRIAEFAGKLSITFSTKGEELC